MTEHDLLMQWKPLHLIMLSVALITLTACRYDMRTQPRYEPFEQSSFFADGAVMRSVVADTVARGQYHDDEQLDTGRINGQIVDSFPFTPTLELVERGRERYDIFCSPCHGLTGEGQGIHHPIRDGCPHIVSRSGTTG